MRLGAGCWLSLALLAVPAHAAEKAHEHGKGRLDLALEGSQLTLQFEAPLEDLAGFEREARSEKERAALVTLDSYLKSGRAFTPGAAAGCKPSAATVAISASGRGHAEVHATWKYECVDAPALKSVHADIFERYPGLHRIDVRAVTPKGQSAARLTPSNRGLKL